MEKKRWCRRYFSGHTIFDANYTCLVCDNTKNTDFESFDLHSFLYHGLGPEGPTNFESKRRVIR